MINEIYVNNEKIENEFPKKQFKNGFSIKCTKCDEFVDRKWFSNDVLNKKYVCKKCVLLYDNPMFNTETKKKHSEICKSEEHRRNVSESIKGEKNGFYGKKHSKNTIEKIKKGFEKWYKNLSDDEYNEWTKKMSDGNIKLMNYNPDLYSALKRKAGIASCTSQFENCKMNNIEKKKFMIILKV